MGVRLGGCTLEDDVTMRWPSAAQGRMGRTQTERDLKKGNNTPYRPAEQLHGRKIP